MANNSLILKSSSRSQGNSSALADQLENGAKEQGASVTSLYLPEMDINPCDGCDACLEAGSCIIGDDMQEIYPLLLEADAIVIAGPVYWFSISAQAKLCIDRWYGLPDGSFKGKQFGVVLTYADSDLYSSGGINVIHSYESMFRYLEADFTGLVHGSVEHVGEAEQQPALMESAYQLGQKLGTM